MSANYSETPSEFNSLNKSIGNIYSNYAMYNDKRDIQLYGQPRTSGGSVFKTKKDIDTYIKKITQGSNVVGSAVYEGGSKVKTTKVKATKGRTPDQLKPWLNLVKQVRLDNPQLSYQEVLKKAKTMYIKI